MIDSHCHILPGIDDGARTMEQALELARAACDNGITQSICTPHIQVGVYDNTKQTIMRALVEFRHALADENIPLQLHMGAEVRICSELMMFVAQDSIPFLGKWGDESVLLLELPHSHIPMGSDKLVNWLISKNIRPMIAHPERNREILTDITKLNQFVTEGCLLQLTSASVAGQFGKGPQLCAREMLEKGWVTVIATDAHNMEYRPPDLRSGYQAAAELIGADQAKLLVEDNPLCILNSV